MFQKLAPWLPLAGALKRELSLPILHATRISDLATARYAISEGLLDLVGMTRAHIADPHIVNKLTAGEEHRIRPCVGAGYCIDRIYGEGEALCAHNVATGREKTVPHEVTESGTPGLKVVVVGGGPAGMEAARVCAARGHDVVVFEATGELGGQIRLAQRAAARRDIAGIADWLAGELEHLGVDIRWNTLAEAEDVLAETPDVVFIATGGLPDSDLVPGGEACLSTWDVLAGTVLSGEVLVYDDCGQQQAPSCADHIAGTADAKVEFITPDRHACAEMGSSNFPMYMNRFYEKGVTVTADHRLVSVERTGNKLKATFSNEFGGPAITREVNHIVVEHGTLPQAELFHALEDRAANGGVADYGALADNTPQPAAPDGGFTLFRIGDAVASRNIHAAILDARRICQHL